MPLFTINIQLQDADEKDYTKLDKELKKEAFVSDNRMAGKKPYSFAKGSFSREGNITLEDVQHALFTAISNIGKKYSSFNIKNKNAAEKILAAR